MNKDNNKGFTMVELVVAIAILGVLMLIALPTVRMIQTNNKNSKYRAYEKSVASSSKLYVDSYGEDLFGKTHTGCAIIKYSDLKERDLVEDIQIKNNDCSKDDNTYIIVKRTRNKNDHYFPHLTCYENNTIVYGDKTPATLDDSCKIEDGKGPIVIAKDMSPYASNPHYKKGENPLIKVKIRDYGIGLKANQILKYQWYKNGAKQGTEKKLEFKNADFDPKDEIEVPNISNMSQVTEDTTYKVVITGTVEDYDGNQTEANFTITIKYHNTSVLIKIHANKGKLTESYDHNYSISDSGFITYKGSDVLQKIWYGESKELLKVDSPGHINLTRQHYIIPKGKEFNTKADGSGENFSYSGTHAASKFCNASNDDCPQVLYVNWEYGNYTLTYDNNGGTGCTSKTGLIGQPWGTLCTPSKKGFDFIEWRVKNSNTVITKDTKVTGNLTVVAQWKPSIYTLTYNCPDGSTCPKKTAAYNSTWGTLCTPTRTGYTFTGWYDGTNSVTATTQVNGPRTVSCKWKIKSYTLKYNDNGGTGCSSKPITRNHGQAWGTLCTPKRTGYTFTGWTGLSSKTAVKNENLTASWKIDTYKLTYSCSYGSCTSKTATYNKPWGTLCTPTRTGYKFTGWYDNTTQITASTVAKAHKTVACKWKVNSYTLKYNDNGGSGCSSKPITRNHGQAWGTLCTPKRTGYTFTGWTGLSSKTAVKNENLTASWKIDTYKLTYSCSYGSCTSKTATYNKPWGTLCTPTRTGYKFTGWYDNTTQITASTVAKAHKTVACKWKVNSYTLKYNDNGGSGCSSKPITRNHGEAWGTLCTPKRTGYKFTGWTGLKSKTAVQNENLTASWTAETYKLTYKCSYGSCTSKNGVYGKTWGTLCTPTRTGFDFTGWKDSSGTVTASTIVKGNRTVNCNWNPKTYRLTYHNLGGTGCSSKTGIYDRTWGTLCTPRKTCNTFHGWYDGSTQVTASTRVTGNRNVEAKWSVDKYTLTYNNNGGTGCSTKRANCGTTWGTLCKPTRSGYTFNGWYSGSTKFTGSEKVSGNKTVKASWTSNTKTVTVTFDKNGASSIGATSKTCTYDTTTASSCTVKTPTISRTGGTVVGWGTSASATSKSVGTNTNISVSGDKTYFAVTYVGISATFSFNQGAHKNINNLANASRDTKLTCNKYNTNTTCNVTTPKCNFGKTYNSKKYAIANYFTCKWGSVVAGNKMAISSGAKYTVTATGNAKTIVMLSNTGKNNIVMRVNQENTVYDYGVSKKTMYGIMEDTHKFKWDGKWMIDKDDKLLWFHGTTVSKEKKCTKVKNEKLCNGYSKAIITGWMSARLSHA